jgi:hypothetical protein
MSSTNHPGSGSSGGAVGRLGGCLWLVMAGLGFLVVDIALMFSPDALVLLVALLAVPLAIALTVFIAGNRIVAMSISAIAGLIYASLGVWNWFRVEDFERANPGSVDDSGGLAALTFVLPNLAIALWSVGAAALIRRTGSR